MNSTTNITCLSESIKNLFFPVTYLTFIHFFIRMKWKVCIFKYKYTLCCLSDWLTDWLLKLISLQNLHYLSFCRWYSCIILPFYIFFRKWAKSKHAACSHTREDIWFVRSLCVVCSFFWNFIHLVQSVMQICKYIVKYSLKCYAAFLHYVSSL